MEWFVLSAPVPAAVELSVSSVPVFVALLAVAVAPVILTVRAALGLENARPAMPTLRVVEGGKEFSRHAA